MASNQDNTTSNNATQNQESSSTILAADLLVVDDLIALPSAQELAKTPASLRERYAQLNTMLENLAAKKSAANGHITLSEEEFRELSVRTALLPTKMEPGGATTHILTTMKHLLDGKVNGDFLGIAGRDRINDNLITDDFRKNGVNLEPGAIEDGRSAVTFLFTRPDGKRIYATYPGNAREKLTGSMVSDARVARSDSVLIPLSLWSKMGSDTPDTLLAKSWQQDKEIILSIPAQPRFDYGGPGDIHKHLIPKADIIVADDSELAHWYDTGTNTELAVTYLQEDLLKRDINRSSAGKSPRITPAAAFIRHQDNSATVLVAASPPGISPATPAQRYEIAAPLQVSGKKHVLGVDYAMYAGFLAGLKSGLTAQKAGEFAMNVAQTKFFYDSARIPGPTDADKITQERWKRLHRGLDSALSDIGSAIGEARTGVGNPVDANLPRTRGQRVFDLLLYPLIANVGVWALSFFVTYHSNFNQNKANAFVKRSSWFKDQLAKTPGLGQSPEMVRNLNMVVWSFIDGSIMAPVVALFESKRQKISRWLDDRFGTTPEDKSVYDKEIHRTWRDVFKARATTFVFVIATYFGLSAKLFPRSSREGILSETTVNSGIFRRETVKSVNGFVFDIPAKIIGGWLTEVKSIRNWAQKTAGKQLEGMAKKMGTTPRAATVADARYQIEGLVNTGIFELVYTSLCTAGLYFLGKFFAAKRHNSQKSETPPSTSNDLFNTRPSEGDTVVETKRATAKARPQKMTSYSDLTEKSRSQEAQLTV